MPVLPLLKLVKPNGFRSSFSTQQINAADPWASLTLAHRSADLHVSGIIMEKRIMRSILVVFTLFISVNLAANETGKFIKVHGTSVITVQADEIHWNARIKTIDKSLEKSKLENDSALSRLRSVLGEVNIATENIEISPIKQGKAFRLINREQTAVGYFTEVEIYFILNDLSRYTELTNKLAQQEELEIESSNFRKSDIETYNQQALIEALSAAKLKAQYLAEAIGITIGEVLEIQEENSFQTMLNPYNTITNVTGTSDAMAGKISIRKSVMVKYLIK